MAKTLYPIVHLKQKILKKKKSLHLSRHVQTLRRLGRRARRGEPRLTGQHRRRTGTTGNECGKNSLFLLSCTPQCTNLLPPSAPHSSLPRCTTRDTCFQNTMRKSSSQRLPALFIVKSESGCAALSFQTWLVSALTYTPFIQYSNRRKRNRPDRKNKFEFSSSYTGSPPPSESRE